VIAGASVDDLAFDATHGLVGKSLQPEQEGVRRALPGCVGTGFEPVTFRFMSPDEA